MKTTLKSGILLVILLLVSISCRDSKEEMANNTVITNPTITKYQGNFISQAHPTSGLAKVSTVDNQLSFENFKTDSGPKLRIYLVSNISSVNSDYIDLGDIKGINGNYTYSFPANIDFTKYKYVVVWCVDFNVNFGHATLAP